MRITCNYNNGNAILKLSGRMDTTASAQAKNEIDDLLKDCGNIESLTCDAGELEYISSSGLRVLLALAKTYKNLKITELTPQVYRIFEMTGFTKIMTVEKGLRRLSVDGCEEIGRGGVGVVYRINEDTIIKVFREDTSIEEVNTEIMMAKEAFVLGMPTAISFDMVKVENQYGLVYELLNADTLSQCVNREPGKIDHYAKLYANLFRQLHDIHVKPDGKIPSAMIMMKEAIRKIGKYFNENQINLLMHIADSIPPGDCLMHGDLQTKNAMVQGDELMLIDMGEVGYGHPIIDLSYSYSPMMTLVGDYQHIVGMTKEQANIMWDKMIHYYFEGESEEIIQHRIQQIDVAACIRNFTWMSLSDSFPQDLLDSCRKQFYNRVESRKEHILEVCKTFNDWII